MIQTLTESRLSALRALARVRAFAAFRAYEEHSYSSTQIDLPPALAAAVAGLQGVIPDGDLASDGREDRPHVTAKYGLTTNDPAAVGRVVAGHGPVALTLGKTAHFAGEDHDVVYVAVTSPGLVALNRDLTKGLPNVQTQPTYIPHATVAYVKPGLGQQYAGLDAAEGLSGVVNDLTFITKEGEEHRIPLAQARAAGGPGSGNYGHSGRPGEVGGSGPAGTVYHGSNVAGIQEFTSTYGAVTAWFSEKETLAKQYAEEKTKGHRTGVATVYPVKLDIKKPLVIKGDMNEKTTWREERKRTKLDFVPGKYVSEEVDGIEQKFKRYEIITSDEFVEAAKKKGYDGVKVTEGGETTWGVFDPKQITHVKPRAAGGPGSGNYGHAGRPGEVGGSAESSGNESIAQSIKRDTWYHASTGEITQFLNEKIRGADYDAPYTGIWLSTDTMTSPAMVNPSKLYEVQPVKLDKIITRPEANKFARKLFADPDYEEKFKASGARGGGDYVRRKLLEAGYDAVLHSEKPVINKEELERTGSTKFTYNWRPAELRKETLWAGTEHETPSYDLYQSGEHITGFSDPQELIDQFERVLTILDADNTKIVKEHPSPWLRGAEGGDGPGKGNWGHAGRPGEVGGSAPGDAEAGRLRSEHNKAVAHIDTLVDKVVQEAAARGQFTQQIFPSEDPEQAWQKMTPEAKDIARGQFFNDAATNVDAPSYEALRDKYIASIRENNAELVAHTLQYLNNKFTPQEGYSSHGTLQGGLDVTSLVIKPGEATIDLSGAKHNTGTPLSEEEKKKVEKAWQMGYQGNLSDAIEELGSNPQLVAERKAQMEAYAGPKWEALSVDEKLNWVPQWFKDNPDILNVTKTYEATPPKQWLIDTDVQTQSGRASDPALREDYDKTRVMARGLAEARTEELFKERGLGAVPERMASGVWDEWKSSSTSGLGLALQLAAAEELGGHHRLTEEEQKFARDAARSFGDDPADWWSVPKNIQKKTEEAWIKDQEAKISKTVSEANKRPVTPQEEQAIKMMAKFQWDHGEIGNDWGDFGKLDLAKKYGYVPPDPVNGMDRLKAYVRAQWETTQYLMEKAGKKEAELYRAIILPNHELDETTNEKISLPDDPFTGPRSYLRLPDREILRNGAASTTSNIEIANSWGGAGGWSEQPADSGRVVIRFKAPATSLISLPVFGANLHNESEYVMVGTKDPWTWDAWRGRAPKFAHVPVTSKPEKPTIRAAGKTLVIDLLAADRGQPHWMTAWRQKSPTTAEYNPDQPRDEHGRWAPAGGGGRTKTETYYHGTNQDFLENIVRKGILGEKSGLLHHTQIKFKPLSTPGHVYVTTDLEEAKEYAGHGSGDLPARLAPQVAEPSVQNVVYDPTDPTGFFLLSGTRIGGSMKAVLEVELPPSVTQKLVVDKRSDILSHDKRVVSKVARSYEGDIKPEWIKKVHYQTTDIATGEDTWHTIEPKDWKAPEPTKPSPYYDPQWREKLKAAEKAQRFYIPMVIEFGDLEPTAAADWDESEHPRDEGGKFTGSGGDNSVTVEGRTLRMVLPDRAKRARDVLVPLDVEKFDQKFQQEQGFYVGPGGAGGINDRYARFGKFLEANTVIDAPEVSVQPSGRIGFTDGRHRYAYLRDKGVKVLPVAMTKESAALARKHGLLATIRGAAEWDEADHPRDESGKFTDSGRDAAVAAAIQRGEAHTVSEDEFLRYHKTGSIESGTYERYEAGDLGFIRKDEFQTLLDTRDVNGQQVEIRLKTEPAQYAKRTEEAPQAERDRLYAEYEAAAKALGTTPMMAGVDLGRDSKEYASLMEYDKRWRDSGSEWVRDASGQLVYYSPEEMKAKGLPPFNYTVGAFVGDKTVGYADNEFGATGVYMARDYQRHGLGLTLLKTYLEKSGRLAKGQKIGQMTPAGAQLVRKLHQQLVKEANSPRTAGRFVVLAHAARARAYAAWRVFGGPGSGNFGHAGRPGEVGGSGPGAGVDRAPMTLVPPRIPAPVPRPSLSWKAQADIEPQAFIDARNRTTRPGYLSPLEPAQLQGSTLYMDEKHEVGGALTASGDMENLFNNGGPQRAATEVLLKMIADGGKTADAFDGYLPKLYANFGLVETGRMKFNPEYAPPGWNFERDDNPDVVFLAVANDVGTPDEIRDRVYGGTQKEWTPRVKSTKYYDDYDQGKRDALAAATEYAARHARPKAARARALAYAGGSGHPSHDDRGFRTRLRGPDGRKPARAGAGDWRSLTAHWRSLADRSVAIALGGPGSGNYGHSGRPGEIGGSGPGGEAGPRSGGIVDVQNRSDRPTVNLFPWSDAKASSGKNSRRFLYYPKTNTFILGGEYFDGGTHAEDLHEAVTQHGVDPLYDSYVKGIVTGQGPTRPAGQITFIHAEMGESRSRRGEKWEDPAFVFDQYASALKFFLAHGANGNTEIDGAGHFLPESRGTIRKLVPEFLTKKSRNAEADWDETKHPRDDAGKFTDSGGGSARTFTSDEGYAWHEQGAVPEWAKGLPETDRRVLNSYASFGYGDMNARLRGDYTPPIIDHYMRPATPEEIAQYDKQTPEAREKFGISFGKYPKDYHPDDPTNRTEDGGRIVHNVFYTDPEGNKVEWSVQRGGPDLARQAEIDDQIAKADAAIRERGYVLPEAIEVGRAAYLPGITEDDLQAMVGQEREEKAFTSTMVGDAEKRLTGYASIAKGESLYRRFGGNQKRMDEHKNEPGVAVRMHIELPAGTKVAPIEAVRRTEWKYPYVKNEQGEYVRSTTPTYDDSDLRDKERRSESEVLLGSGARFKVVRAERGERHPHTGERIHDLYLQYIGGGSSSGH